jgi:hypothetical protein
MTATRSVPVARRQLTAEPTKLVVTVLAVASAVALVLLLAGLRRGMGEQVTLYVDRQAPVLVGQAGARNFLSQTSVLPESLAGDLERVPGVAEASPISQQYAILRLHGRPVLTLLIGYDPGNPGGPWKLASGRVPNGGAELVLDSVLASEHGLEIGSTLAYRGTELRIVGLSSGTSGFMTPLAFAPRSTVNAVSRLPRTAGRGALFRLVGVQAAALALTGTALGIALAAAAARGISSFAPKYLIAISAGSVTAIALSALAMALVAAFVPARFLAHLDPASAFRR